MSHPSRPLAVLTAIALAGTALPAVAEQLSLSATLSAAEEVPPNDSPATGSVEATYDTDTNILDYTISYSGLTGDATAAGGLILIDDSADPYSVEAVRASMGAIFTQAVAIARWEEFVTWLRSGPGQLVGTSLKTDKDYLDQAYEQPCFLLIGNESQGLPASYEAACDLLVKIPMAGRADSLNAAVATAVMAFHVRASWNQAGK